MTPAQPPPPEHGVKIRCTLEEDPRYGRSAWVDLAQLEDEDHAQALIDGLTGRSDDPYPDAWIEEGTFEVAERRGLGMLADSEDGPFVASLADLACVAQALKPSERPAFLQWARGAGDWWDPGCDVHAVADVIEHFRASAGGLKLTSKPGTLCMNDPDTSSEVTP